MPEKPYEYMESADSGIQEKIIEDFGVPDNFVESSEGGAVDGEMLAEETEEDERVIQEGLLRQFEKLLPEALDEEGRLRY
jgi:hypothetical protein